MQGFTPDESEPLQAGLTPFVNSPQAVLKAILSWTGGQPFLTQKLCQIVVNAAQQSDCLPSTFSPGAVDNWVDGLVRSHLLTHWESQDEPIHLRTIRDHLFWHRQRTGRILGIYQRLLQAETVATDDSHEQNDHQLSGLVVSQGNHLAIKNRIYQEVFTLDWAQRQLRQLRPYASAFDGWMASGREDATYLLRGQTLIDAEQWARDESLSDLDYQFLSASQDAERQHIQQLLDVKAESERFFRQLAEAVPQMVWIVEPDGTLSYTNHQSSDFSGYPSPHFQGWQGLDVIHPEDRDRSRAAWQTALDTGTPYEVQLRMQDAAGHYRWFLNRAVPIRDSTEQVVKWFGTSTDLDEVKRSEEAKRLQEVEKRLLQEQKASRLQRWLLGTVSVAFVVASGLGLYALGQQRQAEMREIEALTNTSEAQFASGNRLDALVTAIAAQTRLTNLAAAPSILTAKVERDLRRAALQAIEFNRLSGDKGRVLGIAISPDGEQIASSHQQSTIFLWGADGQLQQPLVGHDGEVNDVEFSADGQMLASSGRDRTVQLWSREGDLLKTFQGHQNRVVSIDISPDSNWIASASEDGTVKLWSVTGQQTRTLTDHDGAVWDVAFSPDGQWLASAGWDNTVILWRADGTKVRTFKKPITSDRGTNRLVSVVFSPDGQTLVAGDWKGNMVWWQADGTLIDTATEHPSSVVSLTFSPDGQTLVSGSWDSTIKFWNRNRVVTRTLTAHPSGTWEVAFTADGQTLVSGGEDKLVRLWRPNSEVLTVLRGHRTSVWQVIMAPPCTAQVACPGRATATSEAPGIISSSTDGTAKVWNREGHLLQTLIADQSEIWDVAISPDGATIATATHEGKLTWWSRTGERLKTIQAHTNRFNDLDFSPDGAEIASAS